MNRFAIAYWTETKGLGLAVATTSLADPKAAADEYFASVGLGGMIFHSKVIAIGPVSEEIGQRALAQRINEEQLGKVNPLTENIPGTSAADVFSSMSSSGKGPASGA